MKLLKCHLSFPRFMKGCLLCFGVFVLIEVLVFNIIIFYIFWNLRTEISAIVDAPGSNLLDKLTVSPIFETLIHSGKNGGFASLLQQTLGRVYIEPLNSFPSGFPDNLSSKYDCAVRPHSLMNKIGFDVSSAGEVIYIYKRILNLRSTSWKKLVVDIGANDGILSSNSYNFIQWGWSAILVEPQDFQLGMAKRNTQSFSNQNADQKVQFLRAVLDDHDGFVNFKLSSDLVSMESHVVHSDQSNDREGAVIKVRCYSVKTFTEMFHIPKLFGILSIDAEGSGSKILHQWIKLGFRPTFIIYESLHDPEDFLDTKERLINVGYTYLTKRGWNHIFEYDHPVK